VWTGIRPLITHNVQLVDNLNDFKQRIDDITKKKKKMTPADHALRDHLEWQGSFYWKEGVGPVIPSDNIEKCIRIGAQKSRRGKDVEAVVLCTEPEIVLEYDGPRDRDKMWANKEKFVFRKPVKVNNGKSTVIRVRPMFPTGWRIKFSLMFDEHILGGEALKTANLDAGALVGLCEWRPKFGRFTVEFGEIYQINL
jgi:hypothetical protein